MAINGPVNATGAHFPRRPCRSSYGGLTKWEERSCFPQINVRDSHPAWALPQGLATLR